MKLKKVIAMTLLVVILSMAVVLPAMAFVPAIFLGAFAAGTTLGSIAQSLAVIGVIAAGTYIGLHVNGIDMFGVISDNFASIYSRLNPKIQEQLNTEAIVNGLNNNTSADVTVIPSATLQMVNKLMLLESTMTIPDTIGTFPNLGNATGLTDAEVMNGYALVVNGQYYLVGGGSSTTFKYYWLEQQGVDDWIKVSPAFTIREEFNGWCNTLTSCNTNAANQQPAFDPILIQTAAYPSQSDTIVLYLASPTLKPYFDIKIKGNDTILLQKAAFAIPRQYAEWLGLKYKNLTIGLAPWVGDIPNPYDLPAQKDIKVPAGTITGANANTVTVTEAAAAEMAQSYTQSTTAPTRPIDPGEVPRPPLNLVTTKFPFSLPWDIYHLISLVATDPITPEIEVDEEANGMPVQFEVSLAFLDPYIGWFRAFILVFFGFFLIGNTSRWFGGAK